MRTDYNVHITKGTIRRYLYLLNLLDYMLNFISIVYIPRYDEARGIIAASEKRKFTIS